MYEWSSERLLAAGSRKRRNFIDSGLLHTASTRHWIFINQKHRFYNATVLFFQNCVWYEQASYKFWTTVRATAGAESSGGYAAHFQKLHQGCCNYPLPMLGDRGHCPNLSDGAEAPQAKWFWQWRQVHREEDCLSPRNVCNADSERELRHSGERRCGGCRKTIPTTLFRYTQWPYNGGLENL